MEQKTELQKESELKQLRVWVKQILPEDHDKVDLTAIYDSTLCISENKTEIRKQIKGLVQNLKEQVEYAKAEQEKISTQAINRSEEEVRNYNNSLTYTECADLDQFYEPITQGVKKMCQGYSNLLFIRGRGAIGKTFNIRKALIQNKADFVEISGDVTGAYLYRLLYENNGKIIYLKETVKLLQMQGSLNLLKSACETEDAKILTKSNYSKEQDDLPDSFLCRCKFIFDYNNVFNSGLRDDFEALVTRGDYRELLFSDEDVKQLLKMIAKKDWEKEVTEELIRQFESNKMIKLNLRTQWKAFRTYEYAKKNSVDWRKELGNDLKNVSRVRVLLYTLIGDKAVKTAELKRLLLRNEIVNTLRTADRKVNEWLFTEELYKVSEGEKDFYVCINQRR